MGLVSRKRKLEKDKHGRGGKLRMCFSAEK